MAERPLGSFSISANRNLSPRRRIAAFLCNWVNCKCCLLPPCPLCPRPLTIRRTWAVINKALNRAPSSLKAACCQPPSYISLSVYVFLYSFSCVAGTLGIQSHERGQEANKSSCPLVSLFLSSLKNKMKTIWLGALHFPPPCTSIDEEFHLQWGFTLIREGAVIQTSIHFSGASDRKSVV